jgi:hypothetical protein
MTPLSLNFLSFESRQTNRASLLLFTIFIAIHPLAAFALIAYFFPATWEAQWSLGIGVVVATTLAGNLIMCFGEYFFHRYMLHVHSTSFLGRLATSHLNHHKLTSIRFTGTEVRSEYPIVDEDHAEASTFPPWALVAFMVALTPFLGVAAFSFPHIPVLIGGYVAISIAHYLYETIHLFHHTPYDPWWKTKIEGPVFGTMWRKLYGFHQAHHANYKCNMNIAGFFGVPVADLVFRTYEQPAVLLLDGAPASKDVACKLTTHPRWPVSSFDRAMLARRKRMAREQAQRAEKRARAKSGATGAAGAGDSVLVP